MPHSHIIRNSSAYRQNEIIRIGLFLCRPDAYCQKHGYFTEPYVDGKSEKGQEILGNGCPLQKNRWRGHADKKVSF